MKACGSISMIRQKNLEGSVQELDIYFADGSHITQFREWPAVTYEKDKATVSLHELLFLSVGFAALTKHNVDEAYVLLCSLTKLVKGPELTEDTVVMAEPATIVVAAPEPEVEEDDFDGEAESDDDNDEESEEDDAGDEDVAEEDA